VVIGAALVLGGGYVGQAVAAAPRPPAQASDAPGGVYLPLTPSRLLDTRAGATPIGPDSSIDLQVAGHGGVPTDAIAAVLNVTVTEPTAESYLTVWPTGVERPLASNLNWVIGRTIPNVVVATLGTDGMVSIYNSQGNVQVVVDVTGYYLPATAP
jgi:hypothetical protein